MQGLGQGLGQSAAALQPNVAALSTLARLACSGGLAGLTAATAATVGHEATPPLPAFAGHSAPHHGGCPEAGAGDEHTATNMSEGRPGAPQARCSPALESVGLLLSHEPFDLVLICGTGSPGLTAVLTGVCELEPESRS